MSRAFFGLYVFVPLGRMGWRSPSVSRAGMASCSFDGAMDGTAPKNRHIINRIDKGRAV